MMTGMPSTMYRPTMMPIREVFGDNFGPSEWVSSIMPMMSTSSVVPTIASMSTGQTGIKCDMVEKDTCYHILMDIPGISKNDIDVSLENGVVTVCGNKLPCCEFDSSKDSYHFKERATGRFTRCFKLPPNADFSKSTASHVNGVLVLTFPKMTGSHSSQQKLMIR